MKSKADMAEEVVGLILSGKVSAPQVRLYATRPASYAMDGTQILKPGGQHSHDDSAHSLRERHELTSSMYFPEDSSDSQLARIYAAEAHQLQDSRISQHLQSEMEFCGGGSAALPHQYDEEFVQQLLLQRRALLSEQQRERERLEGATSTILSRYYQQQLQQQQQKQQARQLASLQFPPEQTSQEHRQQLEDRQYLNYQQYQQLLLAHQHQHRESSLTRGAHCLYAMQSFGNVSCRGTHAVGF